MLRAKQTSYGYEIELGKTFGLYRTIWNDKRYDANDNGTGLVGELVPGSPFTFPKSLWAVYDSLLAATGNDPDAIVLDFFAGSGTTRSEEHTSELQSLMRISYAVLCLNKKKKQQNSKTQR